MLSGAYVHLMIEQTSIIYHEQTSHNRKKKSQRVYAYVADRSAYIISFYNLAMQIWKTCFLRSTGIRESPECLLISRLNHCSII